MTLIELDNALNRSGANTILVKFSLLLITMLFVQELRCCRGRLQILACKSDWRWCMPAILSSVRKDGIVIENAIIQLAAATWILSGHLLPRSIPVWGSDCLNWPCPRWQYSDSSVHAGHFAHSWFALWPTEGICHSCRILCQPGVCHPKLIEQMVAKQIMWQTWHTHTWWTETSLDTQTGTCLETQTDLINYPTPSLLDIWTDINTTLFSEH